MRSFLHGLGLALIMGRRVLALLWASIEESRLDRPKSSFVGLSLMVLMCLKDSYIDTNPTLLSPIVSLSLLGNHEEDSGLGLSRRGAAVGIGNVFSFLIHSVARSLIG
ncbi:hypothetical protein CFP56_006946 [Quercus suber]|uniref:Uncharacterized protein n=1 Tax=Quercus suber TaxID=58331 RepID=A0AAW0L8X5_QUESU